MHVNITKIQNKTTQILRSRSMPRQSIFCRPKSPIKMIKDTWKVADQGAGSLPPRTLHFVRTIKKKKPTIKNTRNMGIV